MNDEQSKTEKNTDSAASTSSTPEAAAGPASTGMSDDQQERGGLSWRQRLSPLWFLAYQFVLLLAAYQFNFANRTMGLLQTGGLFILCVHLVWLTAQDRPTPQRTAYLKVFLGSAIVLGIIAACYVYIIAQSASRT